MRIGMAITLLVLIFLAGAVALPAEFDTFGQGEPIMKVVDATTGSTTINLDDPLPFRVNVTLTVTTPVANLYTFQVAIKYDMSLLNCTSATMNISNPSFVFYGKSIIPITPLIVVGASSAYVYWGASLIVEPINLPAGQYLLGQINFTAVASGTSLLDIITVDEVKPEYPDNSFLLDFGLHDIPFLCENCQVNVAGPTPTGPIYIRADGSIDPPTAPVSTPDNVTYTITENIVNDSIVVERDNIVIDGAGYKLQGTGDGFGINLTGRTNVTIQNTRITTFAYGIWLYSSSNSNISQNNITNNQYNGIRLSNSSDNAITKNNIENPPGACIVFSDSYDNTITENNITRGSFGGINLSSSSNNTITKNNITRNSDGIYLVDSFNNAITNNNIADNGNGIFVVDSSSNRLYHNSLSENAKQVYIMTLEYANVWDDGYPSGGNHWSDYAGVDADMDGIGDTPYVIDADNQDNYPLMNPWEPSHDIAVTEVVPSKTIVGQGYTMSINVTSRNKGTFTETFNITVYANAANIALQADVTLTSRNFTTVTFTWNTTGFAKGNYTISANITQVSGETDATDNILTDGWVCVVVPCDITGPTPGVPDGRTDIRDIAYMCTKFMTTPASPNWNPNCDINDDGIVDMRDISIACSNFMKT